MELFTAEFLSLPAKYAVQYLCNGRVSVRKSIRLSH